MRSAILRISSSRCETNKIAAPSARSWRRISVAKPQPQLSDSAAVGSSRIMTGARLIKARAISTICLWPVDNMPAS